MKLLLTAGGTGGHIFPALAIGHAFTEITGGDLVYIGTLDGMEKKIVYDHGISYYGVHVHGFKRSFTFENIKRSGVALASMTKIMRILRKEKPDLVIGTGGYVSGPVLLVAKMMGFPTAIQEQNVLPGITNKILARFVDRIYLGFAQATKYLSRTDRVLVTGNPIRTNHLQGTKEDARKSLGLEPNRVIILSFGGSGGFMSLNHVMVDLLPIWMERKYQVIHMTGRVHYEDFIEEIGKINNDQLILFPFIDNLPTYLRAADLIITSAGAISIAEMMYLGKPSIIIPKAYTAENHQEYNAKNVQEHGAGYYVLEKELTPMALDQKVQSVLSDPIRYHQMERNAKALSQEDVEKIIVKDLLSLKEI